MTMACQAELTKTTSLYSTTCMERNSAANSTSQTVNARLLKVYVLRALHRPADGLKLTEEVVCHA